MRDPANLCKGMPFNLCSWHAKEPLSCPRAGELVRLPCPWPVDPLALAETPNRRAGGECELRDLRDALLLPAPRPGLAVGADASTVAVPSTISETEAGIRTLRLRI